MIINLGKTNNYWQRYGYGFGVLGSEVTTIQLGELGKEIYLKIVDPGKWSFGLLMVLGECETTREKSHGFPQKTMVLH